MEAIQILAGTHQRVVLAGHGSILGGILPVLTGQGSLGIDGIGHVDTWLIELVLATILTTLLVQANGLVEILIDLYVGICQRRQRYVTSALVYTERDTRSITLRVLPAEAVELCQTEERIGTERQRLSLQESLVGI